ncbi:MAG: envelope stress response membrane protein PspB [Alphaproteobacteria bacterium]|nr:envelope stress response membrane protein PspB [Alphaproteobacteria bacterium]
MDIWIVFFVPTVLLIGVVLPMWLIFHYITKWREQKRRHVASEEDFQALWRLASRLEERLDTLEHVVDDADRPGADRTRRRAPQ